MRCAQYFPCSAYFEGERSSAMPNSVYSQIAKKPANGDSSHPEGGNIADFVSQNGKLEAFKDLTV